MFLCLLCCQMTTNKPNPTTVRLTEVILARVEQIVARTGKSQHAVLLDIVDAGLREIEQGRYNPYAVSYPLTKVTALRSAASPKKSASS